MEGPRAAHVLLGRVDGGVELLPLPFQFRVIQVFLDYIGARRAPSEREEAGPEVVMFFSRARYRRMEMSSPTFRG